MNACRISLQTGRNCMPHASLAMVALCLGAAFAGTVNAQQTDLVAHEWGTFTSIAGNSGTAVQWYPWSAPSDLPNFVEHLQAREFKLNLAGTIRMETPVLYFYSPTDATVSVHVSFSKGLITEWYPHATRFAPNSNNLRNVSTAQQRQSEGSVAWEGVALTPSHEGRLARERGENRYYAARLTNSTPLQVSSPRGTQHEKFLFYRGVSSEASPIAVKGLADGRVEVTNLAGDSITHMFLFERRGASVGVRSITGVGAQVEIPAPELNGTAEMASEQILAALMDQGLYPDEARAMLETWKDSWFEEGSRLIYLVPQTFVDRVLPLSISPEPTQTTRVFVGRLELVTAKTRAAIETALANRDEQTLRKYTRFLEPMLQILLETEADPQRAKIIRARLDQPYAPLVAKEATAEKREN
jgi:hypothetical protein